MEMSKKRKESEEACVENNQIPSHSIQNAKVKLNEDKERVVTDRWEDVPLGREKTLWFFWYYENGDWDAELGTRIDNILEVLKEPIKEIFCVWHGSHRTNMFLMNKEDLIKRLKELKK